MTHDEIQSLLDAYLDDELDLATGLAVGASLIAGVHSRDVASGPAISSQWSTDCSFSLRFATKPSKRGSKGAGSGPR